LTQRNPESLRGNAGLDDLNPVGIDSQPAPQRLQNPEGIPSFNPGLRGTSYPGSSSKTNFNPNGVVFACVRFDKTPMGF